MRSAQVNVPEVYWTDIGGSVDAVSARTWAHNRIYGVPIAPLGQTDQSPAPAEIQRFRQVWAAYGAGGPSWWSWQATGASMWAALAQAPGAAEPLADPGWPRSTKGAKGDDVVGLQEHLIAFSPDVPVDGMFGTATRQALMGLQTSRGLPASGETDAATLQAVLALPVQPGVWVSRGSGPRAAAAAGRRPPASARLPARREEIPPPAQRR
jgi:hypothetical protein